jgi:hypothetical protein
MELMREKILLNGKIAELKGALDDAVNAKEVFAGEIKNEESKFKNLFQTIKEESSPVKGGGHYHNGRRSESSTDISQQVIVLSQRDPKTGDSISDNSINQRSDIDNTIDQLPPYKILPPPPNKHS